VDQRSVWPLGVSRAIALFCWVLRLIRAGGHSCLVLPLFLGALFSSLKFFLEDVLFLVFSFRLRLGPAIGTSLRCCSLSWILWLGQARLGHRCNGCLGSTPIIRLPRPALTAIYPFSDEMSAILWKTCLSRLQPIPRNLTLQYMISGRFGLHLSGDRTETSLSRVNNSQYQRPSALAWSEHNTRLGDIG
jgi:hypothetical protein